MSVGWPPVEPQPLFHHGPTSAEPRFPEFAAEWSDVRDEKVAQAELVRSLRRGGHCTEQCLGTWHDRWTGEKKRLRGDILFEPFPASGLRMGPFIVEVKPPGSRTHKDVGDHIKQAIDYRDTYWDGHGQLPVFMFPGLRMPAGDCCDGGWRHARRVLGSLGLGEIFMERRTGKLSIFLTGHALVWNDKLTHDGRTRTKAGMGIGSAMT